MKRFQFGEQKWVYVLLSVLIATIFWWFVIQTQDPSQDTTIRNIPVTVTGERVLESQGLTVKELSAEKVNLEITAPASVIRQLRDAGVSVSLDVSRLSAVGDYALSYTPVYPSNVDPGDITVNARTPNEITVTVDRLSSSTFEIQPRLQGSVASGYQAGSWSLSEETVTISGAVDQVSQIDKVEAVLTGEGLSQRVSADVPLVLLDKDGNVLTDLDVNLSIDSVYVTLAVVVIKEIPLTVNFISGGGATQEDIQDKYEISPASITVSGEEDAIEDLTEISLGSVNLAKVVGTSTFTFSIDLDSRLENVSGITQATVTVTIDDLATKTLSAENIDLINVPEGRTAEKVTLLCPVVIRGQEEDLELIDQSQIRIVADLSNVTSLGSCTVPVEVYLNASQSVGVIGEYRIVVNIS